MVFVTHTIEHPKRMEEIKSWAKGDLHFHRWEGGEELYDLKGSEGELGY